MKIVDLNELKIIKKFSYGAFSDVYLVEYKGNIFCYKQFKERYPKDILNNISELNNIKFSNEYLTPISIIQHNNETVGYLSNYNKDLEELEFVYFKKNKLMFLKKTRDIMEKLHKNYKRIHGDISLTNVLVNKEKKDVYLIDFDSSLYINQDLGSGFSFSEEVQDFINNYRLYRATKSIDIFKFNVTTLKLLCDVDYIEDVYTKILKNKLHISGLSNDGKKICKELLLETRKPYSNEYIIDYI